MIFKGGNGGGSEHITYFPRFTNLPLVKTNVSTEVEVILLSSTLYALHKEIIKAKVISTGGNSDGNE